MMKSKIMTSTISPLIRIGNNNTLEVVNKLMQKQTAQIKVENINSIVMLPKYFIKKNICSIIRFVKALVSCQGFALNPSSNLTVACTVISLYNVSFIATVFHFTL